MTLILAYINLKIKYEKFQINILLILTSSLYCIYFDKKLLNYYCVRHISLKF